MKPGYVRVSEILDRLRDKSDINIEVLRNKGKIGTEVHENIAREKSDCIPFFNEFPVLHPFTGEVIRYEKRGLGYFRSFGIWDKVYNPVYKMMEHRFYDDEYMLTGQIDALVMLPKKDKLQLIDFKCSHKPDLEIWNMQAHFYWYLLTQNGVDLDDNFIWIQLNKDGKSPSSFNFVFDENVLSRCLDEVERYHEDMSDGLILD